VSTPGFDVDPAQVDVVARRLEEAAEPLAGAADGAPDVPRAGPATTDVVACLAALAEAVSGLVRGTADAAAATRAAAASYRDADGRAAAALDATINGPAPG
jgi:hypothetical protein